jgi:hypothetical protein
MLVTGSQPDTQCGWETLWLTPPSSGNTCRVIETVTARYRGRCAYCDVPIRVGDKIRRVTNTTDWIHASHDLDA